jgi:hypothetical protein
LSDPGYVAVHRSIWDHDVFEPAPFSEREAWLWLVSSAAWKPTKVRVGYKMIALGRGDLSFSERFLAEKWRWSKTKVHRFLALLESETMITRNLDQGLNQITICNYDKYQSPWTSQRTENGPETDQKRTKEEEVNNKIIADDAADTRGKLVTPEAMKLTDLKFWPPGWMGAPMRIQAWLNQGWNPEIIVAAVQRVVAKARGRPINSVQFFENAIAEEVARQAAPLPIVEIRQAEKVVSYGSHQTSGGSLTASIRRELAELEQSEGADIALPASGFLRISG